MTRIHHNTLKKAAKFGITLESRGHGERIDAVKDGQALASAADPKDALDLAVLALASDKPKAARSSKTAKKPVRRKTRAADEGDDTSENDGAEGDASRSIVKTKYKAKYRPHKMTCGDDLAKKVRDAFMTKKDDDTGKPRLDFEAFVKFAKANECWVEGYRLLKDRHGNRNNGLIRMNVVNRLRARARKEIKIVW